jgi:hypothetical protein
MPVSNIETVSLSGGEVTIEGTLTNTKGYDVTLFHVWLAQPGAPGQNGAGLAIDYLAGKSPPFTGGPFTLTAGPEGTGVVGAFFEGPATASAIAVLSKDRVVTEVIQWSRIVMLPKDPKIPVPLDTSPAGQGEST